jgi:peroxiredoxin Q/BCP
MNNITLTLNEPIENFSAPATGNKIIHLSDYRGKNLILYFYPRDNTPGCTQEGKDFRDSIDKFNTLNSIILGVSRDSIRVHENFKSKQNFPFDLLSDKDENLCKLFNVIKMKNMYGKQVQGIERSTFLIDSNGVLKYEWRKVKVKTHVQEVLDKLNSIPLCT